MEKKVYLGLPAYVPSPSSLPTYEKNAYLDLSPNIPTPSSVLTYEFVCGLQNTLGTRKSASKRVHGSRANLEKVSVVVDLSQSLLLFELFERTFSSLRRVWQNFFYREGTAV